MSKTQEIHEIVLTADAAGLKKADAEHKVFIEKQKAADKILVQSSRDAGKIRVADNNTVNKLLIQNNDAANKKDIIDYKNAQAEKIRIKRQAEAELQKQSTQNSKLIGQSVDLGSYAHLQGLRSQLKTLAPGTENYSKIDNAIKNLTANINAATGKNRIFNRSLLETGENAAVVGFAVYAAAQKFLQFGASTVKAAGEQESALLQLKGVTMGNIEQFDRLTGFSTEMQNKWGIPDEVTESLIAYGLAQERSESQIKKNIEAARILAIVNKTDVETAYKQIDATFEGNVRSLGRQEKDFKSLTEEQLKNGAATDLIISKWGLLANNQDSITVKTSKLTAAWSETKETIGGLIVDALAPLGDSLSNIGLKGQDVVKFVASAIIGIDKFSGVLKITDKASKDLISTFGNLSSQIPLVGGFYSSISGYAMQYRDLLYDIIGVQSSISNGAIYDNARGGTRNGAKTKELDAFAPTRTNTNSGSKGNTTKEKELNFLEEMRKKIAELQTEIKTLGDLEKSQGILEYERLNILDERIKKEKELYELQRKMGLGELPGAKTVELIPLQFRQAGITRNPRDSQILAMERSENLTKAMVTGFEGMNAYVGSMLEKTGQMDSTFGEIYQMINQLINIGKETFSFAGLIGDIISFLPGGSLLSSASGGGGGVSMMGGMPNAQSSGNSGGMVKVFNIIKNVVPFGKAFEIEQRYSDARGGINV